MADKYGILTVSASKEDGSFDSFTAEINDCSKAVFLARCVLEAYKLDLYVVGCSVKVENQLGSIRDIIYQGYVEINALNGHRVVEVVK